MFLCINKQHDFLHIIENRIKSKSITFDNKNKPSVHLHDTDGKNKAKPNL